jgi:hypothetical protein
VRLPVRNRRITDSGQEEHDEHVPNVSPDDARTLQKRSGGRLGQHEYQADIELATTPQILSYTNDAHAI